MNDFQAGPKALVVPLCGLLLLVLTATGLYQQQQDRIEAFVAVALAQGAVYFAACALVWRNRGSRPIIVLIVAVAAAMRLMALFAPPYLSSDIYRYVWDGRVLAAGINPYRYIPTDPQLEHLRDPAIWPEINRSNSAPTIYPPAAQAIFFAATRFGETLTVMKAAMLALETAAIGLMLHTLVASGQPGARILIYAWHPLPVWEFAGSGHIDAAVVFFVTLALWLRQHLPGWTSGLALAGAVLTKLYPLVLFPAFWRRWEWRMPFAFALAIGLAYLPFLDVGSGVIGFLPGHMAEEGFTDGAAGFYLWSLANAVLPLAGAPVLLSPHYPWYFAWLVVFACLLPCFSLLWLTIAVFLLYLVPVGSQLVRDSSRLIVESIIYLPFAVLAAIEWRQRRREAPRHAEHAPR